MNLSTRRMTEAELVKWISQKNRVLWTFRISDKFSDSGITGIASMEHDSVEGKIVDFILSCRVMGRKIEEFMIHVMGEYARSINLKRLTAHYLPTPKNMPCYKFWKCSGFIHNKDDDTFTFELNKPYPKPEHIELIEVEQ